MAYIALYTLIAKTLLCEKSSLKEQIKGVFNLSNQISNFSKNSETEFHVIHLLTLWNFCC